MAKQTGIIQIKGTIGGLTFWIKDGIGYVKKKSSLSSNKVKTSPRFTNTMRNAHWFATASTIASAVYRSLSRQSREHRMYCVFVAEALEMVRHGITKEEAVVEMKIRYAPSVDKEMEREREHKELRREKAEERDKNHTEHTEMNKDKTIEERVTHAAKDDRDNTEQIPVTAPGHLQQRWMPPWYNPNWGKLLIMWRCEDVEMKLYV
jgi:hypothetical protein